MVTTIFLYSCSNLTGHILDLDGIPSIGPQHILLHRFYYHDIYYYMDYISLLLHDLLPRFYYHRFYYHDLTVTRILFLYCYHDFITTNFITMILNVRRILFLYCYLNFITKDFMTTIFTVT